MQIYIVFFNWRDFFCIVCNFFSFVIKNTPLIIRSNHFVKISFFMHRTSTFFP